MNRAKLFAAVEFAHAAAHNATLSASYDRFDDKRAAYFHRLSEEALYAALDALSLAQLSDATIAAIASITNPTEQKAA